MKAVSSLQTARPVRPGLFGWYKDGTSEARRALLAAGLGWMLAPLVAFFGTGFFSGFGAVTAELFPTNIRATAQGFTFNMGRFGSALAPFFVGSLADTHGFAAAFALLSAAFAVGAMTWIWLPETRGRKLG